MMLCGLFVEASGQPSSNHGIVIQPADSRNNVALRGLAIRLLRHISSY